MKKLLALLVVLTMLAATSVGVFADFVKSIDVKEDPVVEDAVLIDASGKETPVEVVVTAISNKNELTEEQKTEIEASYGKLEDEKVVGELSKEAGFEKQAVITEVFDISLKEGEIAKDGSLEVTFKTATDYTGKKVAVGHYVNGKWVIERDVVIEGNTIKVKIKGTSPFAIIVEGTDDIAKTTSIGTIIWICAIAVVVILAIVFIIVYVSKNKGSKKNTAKKSK